MSDVTTTEPSVETRRQIAERIAAEHIGSASYYAEQRRMCADAVEAALKERDEKGEG